MNEHHEHVSPQQGGYRYRPHSSACQGGDCRRAFHAEPGSGCNEWAACGTDSDVPFETTRRGICLIRGPTGTLQQLPCTSKRTTRPRMKWWPSGATPMVGSPCADGTRLVVAEPESRICRRRAPWLSDDGRWLAGSQCRQRRALAVQRSKASGLALADWVASGGATPTSVAVTGDLVYVLNNGAPNIAGFRIADGALARARGGAGPLSAEDADPGADRFRPGRRDARRDRTRDRQHQHLHDRRARLAGGPTTIKSSGKTPYGFDFTAAGAVIVTEAFGGASGAARLRRTRCEDRGKPRSGERLGRRHAQRGLLGRGTKDGRFAYVTNFGDGTISSYAIARRRKPRAP